MNVLLCKGVRTGGVIGLNMTNWRGKEVRLFVAEKIEETFQSTRYQNVVATSLNKQY